MSGLDFTRLPRDGTLDDARWPEPWLVVWAAPGYSARTGLWRLGVGLRETPVEGARSRGEKRGYPVPALPTGVYLCRTAHADRAGQHAHRLLIEPAGITPLSPEQTVLELMRHGG
jgi:hypothetical protein